MKIYILRHEDRTQDCSFFAPLTKKGLEKAVKLICVINAEKNKDEKKIVIYSSPFIRTLQTIYPYAKNSDIKINLEYGLSEIHRRDIIPEKAVGIHLPEYLAESFNYNLEYKTFIKPEEIKYPEEFKDVKIRFKRVLRRMIEENIDPNNDIIIVTHQSLCCSALQIVNDATGKKLESSVVENYEKGKLTQIFDSEKGWTYKPLN